MAKTRFRKLFWFLSLLCVPYTSLEAQQYAASKISSFTAVSNGATIRLVGSAAAYHKITWYVVGGTLSACSVKLQQSAFSDFSSPSDLIASTTCTSNGASAITAATPNFVRIITLTAFTVASGTPTLYVNYTGYINDPTGGGALGFTVKTGTGTEALGCTNTGLTTNDMWVWDGTKCVNTFVGLPTRADDDGTVALATGDQNYLVTAAHATANAVSIAQAGSAGFPLSWTTNFCTYGAGLSTITPTTSTIWNGASDAATLTLGSGDCATITVISVTGNGKYFAQIKRASIGTFGFIIGADNGSALTTSDDQATIFVNRLGKTITIIEIWIECDAIDASTSFNLQNDDGSAANIMTSDVTCNTTGQTGTLSATEKIIANGSRIDLLTVTASAAKRATVWVTYR